MAYTKTNWENLPSRNTPVNATNLNNSETGIKDNNDMLLGNKPMGSIVVEDINSKNMFNKNIIITDASIDSSGNLLSSGYGIAIVPCKPNTTYTLSKLVTNANRIGYSSTYKTTGTIDYVTSTTNNTTVTITTNSTAQYIYINIMIASDVTARGYTLEQMLNSIQLELGNTATSYVGHKEFENKEIYSTIETKIGTWIDGTPLYRKVLTGKITGETTNYNYADINQETNINIKRMYGMLESSANMNYLIPDRDDANVLLFTETALYRNRIRIYAFNKTYCPVDTNFWLAIEYTKS